MGVDDLQAQFSERFGGACDFVVRAPGRVNLIGEHTDYNGLPVLPMALEHSIRMAVGRRTDRRIELQNVDPSFSADAFEITHSIPPDSAGAWGNYVRAGVQGIIDWPEDAVDIDSLSGCDLLVSGEIPSGAGLSSSSALVVASALAFLETNGITYDRIELADMLASAEHYVGTQGGGMDQAACLLGEAGKALKIDFFPLEVTPAIIPNGWSIVVCNTLIQAEKTRSALRLYNRRPIECRIATAMLAQDLGYDPDRVARLASLLSLERSLNELLGVALDFFHEGGYGWPDIADYLSISVDNAMKRLGRMRDGSLFEEPEDGFQLRRRVRHVLTEAARVEDSAQSLMSGDIQRFGELINESHRSCRDDYDISCPELNVLVEIARVAGAAGSRLTGAGFGGCTVSLVPDDRVESFTFQVWDEYYERYLMVKRPDLLRSLEPAAVIFSSKPSQGAQIVR
mgnify:CR=1 FL=1